MNLFKSGWLIIKAVIQIQANPYAKPKPRNRKISESSDEEDSEVSRRTEIDIYIWSSDWMPVFIQEYTSNDFDKITSPASLFLLSELQFFIMHGCILSGLNPLKIMSHNKWVIKNAYLYSQAFTAQDKFKLDFCFVNGRSTKSKTV